MFANWQLQAQGKRCHSDSADATTASKITSFVTAKLLSKAKMPVHDARCKKSGRRCIIQETKQREKRDPKCQWCRDLQVACNRLFPCDTCLDKNRNSCNYGLPEDERTLSYKLKLVSLEDAKKKVMSSNNQNVDRYEEGNSTCARCRAKGRSHCDV